MAVLALGLGLGIVYAFLYSENQKTPRPENCPIAQGGCATCADTGCDVRV